MKITKPEDLQKLKEKFIEGEIVELPPFNDGTPFVAKLKRLSLLTLCKNGVIPNQLLGVAQELFEGKQRSDIKKYAEILDVIAKNAMVEPSFEDVEEVLTDMQRVAIFAYTQNGVTALIPFREIAKLSASGNSGKE